MAGRIRQLFSSGVWTCYHQRWCSTKCPTLSRKIHGSSLNGMNQTIRPQSKPGTEISLYSFDTPNGWKVAILLEELGVHYDAHTIDIRNNAQFQPFFTRISPNQRIPAIVDETADGGPLGIFESGAIMQYLCEKYNSELFPKHVRKRAAVLQWLMWQMSGLGPMSGQMGQFCKYLAANNPPEKLEVGRTRYVNETKRLWGVLDKQLATNAYVAGDFYSIADIAIWPWIRCVDVGYDLLAEFDWEKNYPHIKKWFEKIAERKAVQVGVTVNSL